ncbi:MAG: DUF2141 domain-containing protein [FCB group bacterium]|nr:DUF2141 domain-containing protein [FCB group bacterium]MBL7028227.1 DUF2141 domain-containing protein [Candidatus Neomarinimicrobiota bacterium]MBL7122467.1 DUF2141 domain-containing protein [Candidatus Neomarinimicrobiota bacterium]
MKNTGIMITSLLFGMSLNAQMGVVEVEITDVVAEWGGSVNIGLYEKKGFPKMGRAIVSENLPVRDIKATHKFENIPIGTYAIAVFQDLNGDDKLNRDGYGRPTEPYAFSNNVFGRFGPPKFGKTSFSVESDDNSRLVIHLKEYSNRRGER